MAWPMGEDQPPFRPDGGGQSRPEAGRAERLSGSGERGALGPGLRCRASSAREPSPMEIRDDGRQAGVLHHDPDLLCERRPAHRRSEEHTSELQSLMRISYAVFCLKKKQKKS